MSKNHIVFSLLLCFVLIPGSVIFSEELTLEDTVKKAFSSNIEIKNSIKNIDAAKSSAITQGSFLNPEASFEFNKGAAGAIGLSAFEVSQPFDPPGVLQLKSQIAANTVANLSAEFEEKAAEVYLNAISGFYGINVAAHKEILANENLEYLRRLFAVVESNYRSGKSGKTDMQRAKIGMLDAEKEFLDAENNHINEIERLKIILDLPVEEKFTFASEEPVIPGDSDLNSMLDEYVKNNPSVKKAALEVNSAETNLWMEQLRRLPSLTAGLSVQKEDGADNYTGILGISLPLWNINQGEAGRASAEYQSAKNQLHLTKIKAKYEAAVMLREVKLAAKRLEIAREEAANANEMARLTQQMYMEGKLNLVGYYDQMRTAFESKVKYYEEIMAVAVAVGNITKYSVVSNYFKEKK